VDHPKDTRLSFLECLMTWLSEINTHIATHSRPGEVLAKVLWGFLRRYLFHLGLSLRGVHPSLLHLRHIAGSLRIAQTPNHDPGRVCGAAQFYLKIKYSLAPRSAIVSPLDLQHHLRRTDAMRTSGQANKKQTGVASALFLSLIYANKQTTEAHLLGSRCHCRSPNPATQGNISTRDI